MAFATSEPPNVRVGVEGVDVQEFAAVPTLRFTVHVESVGGEPIRSLLLEVHIRVAAPRRRYDPAEKDRLVELFGPPAAWSTSLRSLSWTRTTLVVPPFTGSARVDLPVGCTYDFEVAVVKYFHALDDGDIPLEFLFSGAMFYCDDRGLLQTARIPWDTEAELRMPVEVWRKMMGRYFPDSAWLQLRRDTLDRLYAYKAGHTLQTLDDAVDALLRGAGSRVESSTGSSTESRAGR